MRDFTVSVDEKKCEARIIRGTITVDGIQIPFTVYRKWNTQYLGNPAHMDSVGTWSTIVLRSKNGILKTFKEGDLIASRVKDKARGWWIDHEHWR